MMAQAINQAMLTKMVRQLGSHKQHMDQPKGGMRARENKATKSLLKNSKNKMMTNKELSSESFERELSSDKREDKREQEKDE
jgi:hypothetical protein